MLFDKLFTTSIENAKDIETNKNFLKSIFINVIPPINIGFKTDDVIGSPIKAKNVIKTGTITFTRPIIEFIELSAISSTSLKATKIKDIIVIKII